MGEETVLSSLILSIRNYYASQVLWDIIYIRTNSMEMVFHNAYCMFGCVFGGHRSKPHKTTSSMFTVFINSNLLNNLLLVKIEIFFIISFKICWENINKVIYLNLNFQSNKNLTLTLKRKFF